MGLELYINGSRCDLYPNAKIPMSFSVNKIAEAIRPSGSFSNQFKLPKTQNNINIFEVADSLNSNTNIPYLKLQCRLIQNGRELISDGFAIIEQSAKDYEVVCYGGNLDFFEKIKDKKLSDLDLSSLDHEWILSVVAASRLRSDYIYSIIDWNSDGAYMNNVDNKVDARTLFPSVFQNWLVDKIIAEADFNSSGLILSDNKYLSELIPVFNNNVDDKTKKALTVKIINTDATTYSPSTVNIIEGVVIEQQDISWNLPSLMTQTTKKGYEVKHDCKLKINIKFDWTKTGGNATFNFTSLFSTSFFHFLGQVNLVGSSGSVDTEFNGNATKLYFHPGTQQKRGDFLQFYLANGSGSVTLSNLEITIAPTEWNCLSADGLNFPKVNLNLYSTSANYSPKLYSFYDALPDMTQSDFIKFVAQKYGIIFQTNSFTKTIVFKQFKEIYDNIPIAKDWSGKLHINEKINPPRIKYHPQFSQENILKWLNDTDNGVGSKLGEGKILVQDESLSKEKDLIQLPFSATEMVKRLGDKDVPLIEFLELGSPKSTLKPRCLILDRQNFSLNYSDGGSSTEFTTDIPMCYYQLSNKTFNLGFDNSLIADNYNEFTFFLDKYKEVEAFYLLDENDIFELDFFIPFYDDYFKHYFMITKINNFIAGKPTKVTSIRL